MFDKFKKLIGVASFIPQEKKDALEMIYKFLPINLQKRLNAILEAEIKEEKKLIKKNEGAAEACNEKFVSSLVADMATLQKRLVAQEESVEKGDASSILSKLNDQ